MKQENPETHFHEISQYLGDEYPDTNLVESVDVFQMKYPKYPDGSVQPVEVLDLDTFEAARELYRRGYKSPVILNMASAQTAGGGWRRAGAAQEESLMFRSTYCRSLENFTYPLSPSKILYSPRVYVFKDPGYRLLEWEDCFWVSAIATPAVKNPKLTSEGAYRNAEDYQIMQYKIAGTIQTAIDKGHDSIVLGALGCGCYHNPVHLVSKMFREIIRFNGYDSKIKIVFAILGAENYDAFRRVFNT